MQYAQAYTTSREKMISGAFASTMHLMFIALLFFGVNWQKKVEPQVNIVDLWSPPSQAEPQAAEPPPEPSKPEVKPEVQPVKVDPTPPKPVAKPEVAKPDIAMKEKEKVEKERRVVEDKQKEAKKREDDAQTAQKAQAEAQRQANEQAAAQRAVAAQAASEQAKLRNEYIDFIRAKIKRFITQPANLKGNEEAEFDVVVLPDGNVLGVKLKRPSGNTAYDNAIERAINRAQPLRRPQDAALPKDIRELNLTFKAQE